MKVGGIMFFGSCPVPNRSCPVPPYYCLIANMPKPSGIISRSIQCDFSLILISYSRKENYCPADPPLSPAASSH